MNELDVEIVYEVSGSDGLRLVVIEPQAFQVMRKMRQIDIDSNEAGGILIGERRGGSFVVKEVTTPSKNDKSSRFSFVRKFWGHQLAINNANERTHGTSNYLGEWHTHPQDIPYPSSIDFNNWRSSLRRHKPCLVCVVGRTSDWWALYENGHFCSLTLLNEQRNI